ncbi:MAG: hypothetical protein KF832_31005, partial [Caldilineaceae bacterium]|nr:hypothetical protein [Caldilineaceae bacterium]
ALWVHFRKQTLPLGPTLVQPITATTEAATVAADEPGTPSHAPAIDQHHYLYIYEAVSQPDDLITLLQYVQQKRPALGRDRWAAFEAERVTIIGGSDDTLEVTEFMRALSAAGVEVVHLPAERLTQLT